MKRAKAKSKAKPKASSKAKSKPKTSSRGAKSHSRPARLAPAPPPITINVDVSSNLLMVSDRKRPVNRNGSERVQWVCLGGTIQIAWGAQGNPFIQAAPSSAQSQIGPFDLRLPAPPAGRSFDYTLTIRPAQLPRNVVLIDPQIEVDDGFSPLRNLLAPVRTRVKSSK